jgi:hypothetical protein
MPGVYLDPITHPDAWQRLAFPKAQLITPGLAIVGKFTRDNEYDVKAGKGTQGATETLKQQPPAKGTITFKAWIPEHFAQWNAILDLLKFDPTKGGSTNASQTTTPATTTGSRGQTFGQAPTKKAAADAGGSGASTSTDAVDTSASSGTASGSASTSGSSNAQPALSAAYAIEVFHPALADVDIHYFLPPEKLGTWEQEGDASGLYKREIEFLEFTMPPNKSIAVSPTGADKTNPGATYASAPTKTGSDAAASGSNGAASDAQGAHGL